jgi:hypothetical protein
MAMSTVKKPKWLVVSSYMAALGTLGGFAGTAVYSRFFMPAEQEQLTPVGVRLVCVAIISLGWLIITGLILSIRMGSVYSGFRRGMVSRKHQPIHFWLLIGIVFLFPLALIGYGVFKFINP